MIRLEDVLRQAVADLTTFGVRFALVGGLAVSIRAEPRFTKDADHRTRATFAHCGSWRQTKSARG